MDKADQKRKLADYATAWRAANPERVAATAAAYAPRAAAKKREKYAAAKAHDPLFNRRRSLWYRYGLTVEQYDAMIEAQGGCAICGTSENLVPDHDHETGVVRAILCQSHNRALGFFGDNPDLLEIASEYLRSHGDIRLAVKVSGL